ncbi:MAG TPA: DNA-processing protein DprA [Candidatus Mediterraneibacter stercoravium]|uniref:DNA-processing protein DprA n=1 Tax=Candidatus Mediterraneibacter stercoravium TaxID=2838685 RepID=A0A9D2K0R3_9FIRM|nr:DNA-processing protein DprA [Candidatus Mediterraneibacter stercoravium]
MKKSGTSDEIKPEYEFWLAGLPIPAGKKYSLRMHMKTAEAVYYIEETEISEIRFLTDWERNTIRKAQRTKDLAEAYEESREKGIRFVPWFSREYPACLLQIPDFPYALYVKGRLPDGNARRAAIVGARKCTPYGEKYAIEFGRKLAESGVEVISGLARGVDGMGQRGALMGKGRTFAVLGSGVDICYPREHMGLYVDILDQGGGILSEYPPGTPPLPRNFPPRNRIISGLSDAVLVMEARVKSGSLITADLALEQGRDVYALPGPVNSELSRGCNRLIQQGAGILLSPEMLLDEWNLPVPKPGDGESENKKMLETPENLVYSCLGLYPKDVDRLAKETELSARELISVLVSLELQGYIKELSKNHYIRVK